ncbi:MAG TPA: methyltransferase domain-containing protein [Dehalococcoidia bacterium]|nr:methyltransferase domain-containing protein [Dehalococcoidia bacterium]
MPDVFTLEKFARHPFYQEVNRRLVALTGLTRGQSVVDLGAGTGAVTRLLVEQVGCPETEVIAVEPSESALDAARRNMENIGDAVVRFVQGGAERLSQVVKKPVDAIFFCNAIHLVPEKEQVLQEIQRTLRADGTFSFNTSFYDGAEPPEAEQFYRKWMMRALRALKTRYGMMPERTRAEARHRLTEDEYVRLLEGNGFRIRNKEVVTVQMPLGGFEDISRYSLWIEGVLPGVPLEAGRESLIAGAREAFKELGLKTSPRNWLLIVANRA